MTLSPMLLRRIFAAAGGLVLAAAALSASAQEATIRKVLPARYPTLGAITAVNPSPVAGVYEVAIDSKILYTDAGGDYLFEGQLIATRDKRNLTQDHIDAINAVAWRQLPFSAAIVRKIGSGARKMVVFADPNCGFCRKLESDTIPKLKDVTIYTFLIPILAEDSAPKAKNVVCAKDPLAAWNAVMQEHVWAPPAPASCDAKVIDQALRFTLAKGVHATPTIFLPNGKLVPSALGADDLEPLLAASQQ